MTRLYSMLLKSMESGADPKPALAGNKLNRSVEGALRDVVRGAVHFDIQEIAEMYWSSEKTDWSLENGDFPNMAPPFPAMFFEYILPPQAVLTTGVQTGLPPDKHGILVAGVEVDGESVSKRLYPDAEISSSLKWLLRFRLFSYPQNLKTLVAPDIDITFGVDQYGAPIKEFYNGHPSAVQWYGNFYEYNRYLARHEHLTEEESVQRITSSFYSLAHPAFLAISFMHCKNVAVVESERNTPSRSARRRSSAAREPVYKSYTLNIRPMRKILETEGHSSELGLKRSLHICRGHFKNFPDDGPGLFGKHHGLYWWESQVRGSLAGGVVEKDYKISKPK